MSRLANRTGNIIAVNEQIYNYIRRDEGINIVEIVNIDDDGILTYTGEQKCLKDSELYPRGIKLTYKQWQGFVEQTLKEYHLQREEFKKAVDDIMDKLFIREPVLEELDMLVFFYINR